MADQKINIDININSEALKQIPQYKAAFEGLKLSIDNLNKAILKQNEQSKETVSWGAKIKTTVKDLADTYEMFQKAIDLVSKGVQGWANILSAAFTLITTFGPQIIEFLGEMFQSQKTKDAAEALKTYNEVMSSYIDKVSGETSQLQLLVNIASNDHLSKQNRIDAIKRLNDLSPQYLNNLTLENIKTKEGIGLLKDYTDALNRKAMEEAIQSQRVELVKQRLNLKPEYEEKFKEKENYRTGKKKNVVEQQQGYMLNGVYVSGTNINKKKTAYTQFSKIAQEDLKLVKKIAALDTTLAETLLKFAPKPNANPTHNKAYWEALMADQQQQLDKLDSSTKTFEKNSKPIIKRINEAKQMIAKYAIGSQSVTIKIKSPTQVKPPAKTEDKNNDLLESQSRLAMLTLDGYSKEIAQASEHFAKLKKANKTNKVTQIQLERERLATLQQIGEKFKKEDAAKLDAYSKKIADIQVNSIKDATDRSLAQLDQQTAEEQEAYKNRGTELLNTITSQSKEEAKLRNNSQIAEADAIAQSVKSKQQQLADEKIIFENFLTQQKTQRDEILQARADKKEQVKQDLLADDIQANQQSGHILTALKQEQTLLDMQHKAAVDAAKKKGESVELVDKKFQRQKLEAEGKLLSARIHAGDKYIDAVLKNSKKDSAIYKAAFLAKKATSIADVIISTKKSVIESLKAYSGIPFIGQALGIAQAAFMAGQGAMSIAEIAKQKPGFAKGGQFVSDGRGALLPGYSRTDNTNAYLRSGEAVVVSEAMRNPWARNLVSAINVAYGGRDFSMPNPGKGYAIGGIYTDGGNANRYYNQPVTDVKEMANTLAYQMINNFPPIYVDVKDVNNQQNILAQTVNRVNL